MIWRGCNCPRNRRFEFGALVSVMEFSRRIEVPERYRTTQVCQGDSLSTLSDPMRDCAGPTGRTGHAISAVPISVLRRAT